MHAPAAPPSDIDTRNVFVTRFEDETAQKMTKAELSLLALCSHILATDAATKEATPWLKLAKFGSKRTDKNCLRHDANVTALTGIEVDYDDEKISFEDAVEIMRRANVRCLLYTSASHKPEAPRWRILVPFSKDYPPSSRASMVGRINGLFGGSLAPESFVLSTSYHYGSVNHNPHHQAVVLDGGFLDLNDRLHAGSIDQYGHRVGHKDFEQRKSKPAGPNDPGNAFSGYNPYPADKDELVAALAVIDPDCGWRGWYKIGCALRFELGDVGEEVFHNFSARSSKYDKNECDNKWSETAGNGLHRAGTIFYFATLANPDWRSVTPVTETVAVAHGDDDEPPAVSDTEFALADEFIDVHSADLRYVAKFGKWQVWRGSGWKEDETVRVFDLARRICRRAAANKEKPIAKAISKARTVAAVETLARSYPSVAATADQWDMHPMKFNVLSGTIDLTTGGLVPHNRLDYITKIATCDVALVGTAHPIWSKFLSRMTDGDTELIGFLQRWMGYCLTGLTSEHRFVFGHGGGANGKGTFVNTFVNIFGDYATISNTDTFTESHNERHTTEIAKLRGARLVVAQEVEEGKQWNETRIKAVTGGDKLTARFMRQDDFEFFPQFKLFMMGNNQPTLRNVDEAMRRRLMLVPFLVTIPEAERDHDLPHKLEAEWAAILRWAVDGCLEWQRIGLAPPAAVKIATNEYFAEQDTFSMWLDEACTVKIGDPDVIERSSDLYESWAAYSTKAGGTKPSPKSFGTKLAARGFIKCTIGHDKHRGFSGVRLNLTQAERNFQSPKF
jgi:P4 family phage/plasmid primase-like protien